MLEPKVTRFNLNGLDMWTSNPNLELSTPKKRITIYFAVLAVLIIGYILSIEIVQYQLSQSKDRQFQYLTYKHDQNSH